MMIMIFLAAQAASIEDKKSSMQPVPLNDGIALFQKICFDKFPDPKAAMQAVAEPDLQLTKSPETPSEAMQPGNMWTSPTARVTYVDADWMPIDIGSPQCSVAVLIEGQPLHSTVAEAMTNDLKLPKVKFGKDRASAQTKWDIPQTNGDNWRMFLNTSQTPSGTEMRTVIMNLRAKKRR
jgi:hypothetical protein